MQLGPTAEHAFRSTKEFEIIVIHPMTFTTVICIRNNVYSVDFSVVSVNVGRQIRVCALNANGSGPFSEWVSATTARAAPDAARNVPAQPPPLTSQCSFYIHSKCPYRVHNVLNLSITLPRNIKVQ
jgi:hypothetical protein